MQRAFWQGQEPWDATTFESDLDQERDGDLFSSNQPFHERRISSRRIRLLDGRDMRSRIVPQGLARLAKGVGLVVGIDVDRVLETDLIQHGVWGKGIETPGGAAPISTSRTSERKVESSGRHLA